MSLIIECLMIPSFWLSPSQQAEHAKSASLLTREKLCSGLSIFSKFLESLKKYLTKSTLWAGDIEGSQNLYDVVNNMEFHRLWSALQFVYCKPPMSANEFTVEWVAGLKYTPFLWRNTAGSHQRFAYYFQDALWWGSELGWLHVVGFAESAKTIPIDGLFLSLAESAQGWPKGQGLQGGGECNMMTP